VAGPPFIARRWLESTAARVKSSSPAPRSSANSSPCSRCRTPASFQSRSLRQQRQVALAQVQPGREGQAADDRHRRGHRRHDLADKQAREGADREGGKHPVRFVYTGVSCATNAMPSSAAREPAGCQRSGDRRNPWKRSRTGQ
jgi:hypothetical protein